MLVGSMIGNPVEVGDGPAAVTLPLFYNERGTPLAEGGPLFRRGEMGRPLRGRGSQKTCLGRGKAFVERSLP